MVLGVESIGYLVPRTSFSGRIHSVFARACNIACGDTLLTLCASGGGDGPTTLRLARGAAHDLRDGFDVGERIDCRQGQVRSSRVEFDLARASVWRPAELRHWLPRARIETHLRNAGLRLTQRRPMHESVIDREGAPVVAALTEACAALDSERAERQVDRLVGWGEGLTPAGDDVLIGLVAGLDALMRGDERRRRFRDVMAVALSRRTHRTTAIAAHYLRLAAAGHFTEPVIRLRHALLCEEDREASDAALRSALAVGATSGADTVTGLLAGLRAWLSTPSSAEAA